MKWRAEMPSGGWSEDTPKGVVVCDGEETRLLVERGNAELDAKDKRIAELESQLSAVTRDRDVARGGLGRAPIVLPKEGT